MRIKEEFKKSGCFWLSSSPDRKVPGILSILDGGNIELETFGLLGEIIEHFNLGKILGDVEGEGRITLEDCFCKGGTSGSSGVDKPLICVNKVICGVWYSENNILLDNFSFSIEGINEWIGISVINVINPDCNKFVISSLPHEEVVFSLDNGMNLLITFKTYLHLSRFQEIGMTQKTYFKLLTSAEDKKDLTEFIVIAEKITTFLCLAIDKIVCLDEITAETETDRPDGTSAKKKIKIYYRSPIYLEQEPRISRMLFDYFDVKDNFEKIINNWINAYEIIEPTLNLYFSTKINGYKYREGRFLALAQGLETYHRRTSDEKVMDEGEFRQLVETILSQCPEENKEWLTRRIETGNEISFRKRLEKIIEAFKGFIGTCRERKKIVDLITKTRNYLTHYDESLKDQAAKDEELYFLCLKMEAFFQLNFLKTLGFEQQEIKAIFDENHQLKKKLNPTKSNLPF